MMEMNGLQGLGSGSVQVPHPHPSPHRLSFPWSHPSTVTELKRLCLCRPRISSRQVLLQDVTSVVGCRHDRLVSSDLCARLLVIFTPTTLTP